MESVAEIGAVHPKMTSPGVGGRGSDKLVTNGDKGGRGSKNLIFAVTSFLNGPIQKRSQAVE